jgi:TonB family protein
MTTSLPATCGLVMAIGTVLLASPSAGATVDTGAAITTYPTTLARMYNVQPDELFRTVVNLLTERKVKFQIVDATNGVAISRWTRAKPKFFGDVAKLEPLKEVRPDEIQLNIFVPQQTALARLHVGSIVRFDHPSHHYWIIHHWDPLHEWLFREVEAALQQSGQAVPKEPAARMALIEERLAGERSGRCLDVASQADSGDVESMPPVVIPGAAVPPEYPPFAHRALEQGQVLVEAHVDEAGFVYEVVLADGSPPDDDFELSTLNAVSLWRYHPATENGCPVPGSASVDVEFTVSGIERFRRSIQRMNAERGPYCPNSQLTGGWVDE